MLQEDTEYWSSSFLSTETLSLVRAPWRSSSRKAATASLTAAATCCWVVTALSAWVVLVPLLGLGQSLFRWPSSPQFQHADGLFLVFSARFLLLQLDSVWLVNVLPFSRKHHSQRGCPATNVLTVDFWPSRVFCHLRKVTSKSFSRLSSLSAFALASPCQRMNSENVVPRVFCLIVVSAFLRASILELLSTPRALLSDWSLSS